jgi:hypothetical protein
MTRSSVLVHPAKTPLVILRQDLLVICEQTTAAAAILAHFECGTSEKLEAGESTWIIKSNREMRDDLLGIYSDKTVSAALTLLVEKGFIIRRNNPESQMDRAYQYQLQIDVVQQAISNIRGEI